MKQEFKDEYNMNAVTPNRLVNAIGKAVEYAAVDDAQIKRWLETEDLKAAIDEICDLVKQSVDEKTWRKITI